MKRFVFFLGFCILTAGCSRLTLATPGELRIENRSDARIESVKVSVNGVVKAEVSGEATSGVIWSPDYPFYSFPAVPTILLIGHLFTILPMIWCLF